MTTYYLAVSRPKGRIYLFRTMSDEPQEAVKEADSGLRIAVLSSPIEFQGGQKRRHSSGSRQCVTRLRTRESLRPAIWFKTKRHSTIVPRDDRLAMDDWL